jgi:MFS family permease
MREYRPRRLHLHGWRHPAILAAAAMSVFAGYGQFSVTATLGAVAEHFGEVTDATGIAAQVGLTGTTLGLGLALIRLASLASLPLSSSADHLGRRRVLLWAAAIGLAVTMTASASPTYWWFILIVALGRPMLSATNAVAGVIAAEETAATDRAKALALIAASYSVGAGIPALLRGVAADLLGFQGVFMLMALPLIALPFVARRLEEPERFTHVHDAPVATSRRLGRLGATWRPRMLLLGTLTFSMSFLTGPINTNLFVYGENVLGLSPALLAVVVLAAGPTGLVGLLTGRWAADNLGRRLSAGSMQALVAIAGALTYSGSGTRLAAGYLLAILAGGAFAPAFGALSAELFATSVRSTAAGWLTVSAVLGAVAGLVSFGVLIDLFGGFGPAALTVAAPVVVVAIGYRFLPETRGMELEESAPERLA